VASHQSYATSSSHVSGTAARRQGSIGPLFDWIAAEVSWTVEIVEHSPQLGVQVTPDGQVQRVMLPAAFELLPRRRVVERALAWSGRHQHISKDDERLPSASEAWVSLTSIRLFLARLTCHQIGSPLAQPVAGSRWRRHRPRAEVASA
jgi:transposase